MPEIRPPSSVSCPRHPNFIYPICRHGAYVTLESGWGRSRTAPTARIARTAREFADIVTMRGGLARVLRGSRFEQEVAEVAEGAGF